MKLHDFLKARVADGRNPFMVPVLLLPDMEPDADIEAWADHTNVHVVFGTDDLVERLVDLAPHAQVLYPPTAEEIAEEVALVMPGQPEQIPRGARLARSRSTTLTRSSSTPQEGGTRKRPPWLCRGSLITTS